LEVVVALLAVASTTNSVANEMFDSELNECSGIFAALMATSVTNVQHSESILQQLTVSLRSHEARQPVISQQTNFPGTQSFYFVAPKCQNVQVINSIQMSSHLYLQALILFYQEIAP
jgi:PBP1b-binding outer membrane lipoprotein LpoB